VNKRGFILENKILAILLMIFNLQVFYSFATSSFAFQYFMDWHKLLSEKEGYFQLSNILSFFAICRCCDLPPDLL